MDQPTIPPEQLDEQLDDLLRGFDPNGEPERAEELPSVDDILNEFTAQEAAAETPAAQDAPEGAPSVDDILNEFAVAEQTPDGEELNAAEDKTRTLPTDEIRSEFSAPLAEVAEGYRPDEADGEPQSADDVLREYAAQPEEADPLSQAEELPDLFPSEYYDKEASEPEAYEAPTVVARPAQKKRSTARKVLRVFAVIGKYLLAIVIALAIAVVGLFGYLTLAEYNPSRAEVAQRGAVTVSKKLDQKTFSILTLNTGYAALGENADFFMDGGTGVRANSEDEVRNNMLGIEAIVQSAEADFVFLQELDTDSDRSFELNQWLQYEYDLEDYETRFALNYSCDYVPYPLPKTIGKVHSGIATFSRYDVSSATRYSLPCPFSWPTRIANLKRCMLVTRIPLEGKEGQELILINFHLEAYDDGEGKAAQTEQLMQYMTEEYEKGNYVIAGGDFNQCFPGTQDAYPLKETSGWAAGQLDRLPTGWKYAYDASTPTCRLLNQPYDPASPLTQYYVIDGFIVSPNVTVTSVKTLNEGFVYTDHNPVLMEVTLTP